MEKPFKWAREFLEEGFLFLKVRPLRIIDPIFFCFVEAAGALIFLMSGLPSLAFLLGSLAVILLFTTRWNLSRIADVFDKEPLGDDLWTRLGEVWSRHWQAGATFLLLAVPILLSKFATHLASMLGGDVSVFTLLLSMFLSLGFAYSLGLAAWSGMSTFWSSLQLASEYGGQLRRSSAPPHLMRRISHVQRIQVGSALLAASLIPYTFPEFVLTLTLASYSASLLILALTSTVTLQSVRTLPGEVDWLLTEESFAYVGTVDDKAWPHTTPVIFVFDGKSIFIAISRVSKKLRNLKQNDNVSLLIDSRDPEVLMNNRAVQIQGRAKVYGVMTCLVHAVQVLRIGFRFRRKYPAYAAKYLKEGKTLPPAWRPTLILSRYLVRVDPVEMTYWKGPTPTRVET